MSVLSRSRAALAGLTVAAALTACAGTAAPEASTPSSSTASTRETSAAASPAGQRIEVQVTGGQVSGDTGRVPVGSGEQVTLVVTSDLADEVHVHGYDLEAALSPGAPAELTFDATLPGVFEVELHEAGTLLLTLQVG